MLKGPKDIFALNPGRPTKKQHQENKAVDTERERDRERETERERKRERKREK